MVEAQPDSLADVLQPDQVEVLTEEDEARRLAGAH